MKKVDSSLAVFCQDLKKDFGEGQTLVHALRDVNLKVEFGRLTLLVGPSGCGKTTLLSLITGLLDPTAGGLYVLGENLPNLSVDEKTSFRQSSVGFVFQQYNLLPSLTAVENVAIPLLISGENWDLSIKKATHLLEELGLGKRLQAFPATLSGGEQQRVAIARALVHEPRLIVCDEPTSALDSKTGHAVMELLANQVLRPDRSIIVVTHDKRIFSFADTIAYMDDGVITSQTDEPQPSE